MKLTEHQIVACMQQNDDNNIYYAFFTRERQYSFYQATSYEDIFEAVTKISGDIELRQNPGTVDFNSDEWLIFAGDSQAKIFYDLVLSRNKNDIVDDNE